MRRAPGGRTAGFTLMEVMLTLLIMAGIMVTVTQILTAARKSRDQIHNVQESQLAGPAILARLEGDLRCLVLFNRDPASALRIESRVDAGFDADSIDFVSSVDSLMPYRERENENFRQADYGEVGYRLRLNPSSDDFLEIYRREDFGVDDEPFEGGTFALLHDRVKGFDIQVYTEDGPDAEPVETWGTENDENSGLPARIEISLTIELAPRLVREQILIDRRTITYKRVIRFPEILRAALEVEPIPAVPVLTAPVADTSAQGGPNGGLIDPGTGPGDVMGGGQGAEGGSDNPFGGGSGDSGDLGNPFGGG